MVHFLALVSSPLCILCKEGQGERESFTGVLYLFNTLQRDVMASSLLSLCAPASKADCHLYEPQHQR